MAKRAQKPPKKREQPWMASAREKLRGKSPVPNERQIQEAFLEIVNAAVDADPGAEPAVVIARAKWAWNLPLVHALSIRPGSEGDQVRDEAGRWLSGPAEEIAAVVPLAQDRIARFSHLTHAIGAAIGHPPMLALTLAREKVDGPLLEIDERGWPSAGDSLLVLAEVVRRVFPVESSEKTEATRLRIAEIAWNLPIAEEEPAALGAFGEEIREKARALREKAPAVTETLDLLDELRRTRFAHDRRVVRVEAVKLSPGTKADTSELRFEISTFLPGELDEEQR